MPEIAAGGYAVEYICRIVDETSGAESVPETAATAITNATGRSSAKREAGDAPVKAASQSKTTVALNSALRVAMPALNAFTNGVAGQVIEKGGNVARLLQSVAVGSAGGAVGAAASLAAWGVGEIVNAFMMERDTNAKKAENIDATNFARQMAGLDKINYSRSGLTGKIRIGDNR